MVPLALDSESVNADAFGGHYFFHDDVHECNVVNTQSKYDLPLPIDWNTDAIVDRRETYYVASQRAFAPYQTPQIFERGKGQYLWGVDGRRFIDPSETTRDRAFAVIRAQLFDCYEHMLPMYRQRVFYLQNRAGPSAARI